MGTAERGASMKPVWLTLTAGLAMAVASNCGGPSSETFAPVGGEVQTTRDGGPDAVARDGGAGGGTAALGGTGGQQMPTGGGGTIGAGGNGGAAAVGGKGGSVSTGGTAGGSGGTPATGGSVGVGGTAGVPASGGTAGATQPNNGDSAAWHFEQTLQAWKSLRGMDQPKLATSTVFKGKQALEFPINITAAQVTAAGTNPVERAVGIATPELEHNAGTPAWSGKTITFHVWVPANFPSGFFTTYVLGSSLPWKDSGPTTLNRGAWNTINLAAPTINNAGQGFLELGLYFSVSNTAWSGSLFVDSVEVK